MTKQVRLSKLTFARSALPPIVQTLSAEDPKRGHHQGIDDSTSSASLPTRTFDDDARRLGTRVITVPGATLEAPVFQFRLRGESRLGWPNGREPNLTMSET